MFLLLEDMFSASAKYKDNVCLIPFSCRGQTCCEAVSEEMQLVENNYLCLEISLTEQSKTLVMLNLVMYFYKIVTFENVKAML